MNQRQPDQAGQGLETLKQQLMEQGLTGLEACRAIADAAEELTRTTVGEEAMIGATWQRIADELGMASRQRVQQKYGPVNLPGISARKAANAEAVHPDTLARHPEKFGYEVISTGGRLRYKPIKKEAQS